MIPVDPPQVLVVDDDEEIRLALERALRLEGFGVQSADGGEAALAAIDARPPSVVVLDVTMPPPDGVEVVKRLRGQGNELPICILSARDGVDDRVAGLQAGADDYLVKPFALEELLARLHALLRRQPQHADAIPLNVGPLRIEAARRRAWIDGEELTLTGREFDLLAAFAAHAGIVLTRGQLLQQVWGYAFEVQTNVVDVFVGYLRRKLESGGRARMIHTVRGRGFVLRA